MLASYLLEDSMMDLLFVGLAIALFAATWALVHCFEHLRKG